MKDKTKGTSHQKPTSQKKRRCAAMTYAQMVRPYSVPQAEMAH
ncbi:MAG: hypothetical protein ACI9OU_001565 [Candidatus Promineifilaceae bacterium]|jgi:hypothetical protein